MAAPDVRVERAVLVRSIITTAVLGAIGVAWGIVVGSQMILLDGVYAFVGIVLSWLLLQASALAQEEPSRRYPFGRESLTPLAIGIQGVVLLATLLYAAVEAVYTIRAGGSDVAPGWAIAYAVVATAGSFGFWMWIRRAAGTSDVLGSEATAWRVATWRGVGMIAGFIVMAVLAGSVWDDAAPYVDPAMVLVTCVAFVRAPLDMVRGTIVELLEGAPMERIRRPVTDAVDAVCRGHGIEVLHLRLGKVGPKLYVELEGRVDPAFTVAQIDDAREDLRSRLGALPYDVWINLEMLPLT
jgi:predicted Co/Zn/Cd cation transporter (cation efflux family)